MSLDWETALRAIPLVAGALISLFRLRSLEPRLRSKLKTDSEILSRLDPESSAHGLLKRNIEAGVERLYARPAAELKWGDVAVGVVFVVGFGFWTAYLVRDGFTWWALLTGYLTFAGMGFIALGFGFGSGNRPNSPKET
ncbi:MAG: hypothetical protein ACRDJT_07795 [Actinomycetota bacterium]